MMQLTFFNNSFELVLAFPPLNLQPSKFSLSVSATLLLPSVLAGRGGHLLHGVIFGNEVVQDRILIPFN